MTSTPSPGPPDPSRGRPPTPLLVAVAATGLEVLLLVGFGLFEVLFVSGSRAVMGLTTTLFFLVYGGGLAWCAWRLSRLESWARAPVVLAQLIQLPVAWSFRGGSTTAVAYGLVLVALVVLVGIFHPASVRALDTAPD